VQDGSGPTLAAKGASLDKQSKQVSILTCTCGWQHFFCERQRQAACMVSLRLIPASHVCRPLQVSHPEFATSITESTESYEVGSFFEFLFCSGSEDDSSPDDSRHFALEVGRGQPVC
jgi:hypothetical protein